MDSVLSQLNPVNAYIHCIHVVSRLSCPRAQKLHCIGSMHPPGHPVTFVAIRDTIKRTLWIKRDQHHVTCFIISLFNAQHVSDVNTSIIRSLRLICWVISWVVLIWFDVCWCCVVVWLGWCGEITQQISRKLLRMDVLTSETRWALNNEIIKQVTPSWSLFIQLSRWYTVQ